MTQQEQRHWATSALVATLRTLIDTRSPAQEAAAGEWDFLAVGNDTIGWHIPDTGATFLLKGGEDGWTLE